MSNLVMWNLILGFVIPNLVAVLQQPRWSSSRRAVVTLLVCIVGGVGTAYFNGQFNLGDIVGSILVTAVAAITFYKNFWKPTGIAPAIENATSKHPPYATKSETGNTTVYLIAAVLVIIVCSLWLLTWLSHRL